METVVVISSTLSHLRLIWQTMLFWSSQLTALTIWANIALDFSSGFLMTLFYLGGLLLCDFTWTN